MTKKAALSVLRERVVVELQAYDGHIVRTRSMIVEGQHVAVDCTMQEKISPKGKIVLWISQLGT